MRAPASAPATRVGVMATPVDVSLCGVPYRSMPASAANTGALPGSEVMTVGAPRCGAVFAALANFEPNSPKVRNCARSLMRPNVAASQNAVEPPLPRITSYPSGSANSSARPDRTRPTWDFTVFCRCEVPRMVVAAPRRASTCSTRTLDGPQPKRPSTGSRSAGIVMVVGSVVVTWVVLRVGRAVGMGRGGGWQPGDQNGGRGWVFSYSGPRSPSYGNSIESFQPGTSCGTRGPGPR